MDSEEQTPPQAIDWDEFHPKSPYDVYRPKHTLRRKWSIVLGIVLYFTAQFSVALLLPSFLVALGVISAKDVSSAASDVTSPFNLWRLIAANVFTAALIILIVKTYYKEPISSLGLTTKKIPKSLLYGIVGFAIAFLLAAIVGYSVEQRFGVDPTQQHLLESATVPSHLPLLLLSGAVVAPIAEEIVFRGYLFKAFRDRFKPSYAILLSAALFSLIHLEWQAALQLFVIGILLAYVYEKTGNLAAPITLHLLNNTAAFLIAATF